MGECDSRGQDQSGQQHSSGQEAVLLVHGLWMTGLEMRWLGAKLKGCGFRPHYFHYPSLSQSPKDSARNLAESIDRLAVEKLHIVAHSLGGIVVLHLFDQFDHLLDGRVVLLGTPVLGSGVARVMASRTSLRPFLGAASEGLTRTAPAWKSDRPLGIVAGTRALGVGRLLGGLCGDSDGTVALCETLLPGASDFVRLPANHMGMLFSKAVAGEICCFLRHGHFNRGEGAVPEGIPE